MGAHQERHARRAQRPRADHARVDEILVETDRRAYRRAVQILKHARAAAQAAGETDALAANVARLREVHRRRPTYTCSVVDHTLQWLNTGVPLSAPARELCVVTCMDARLQPTRMLELEPGDAHVIRNAGGSAREALRSVLLSHHLLGARRVMVIKHTDCAMEGGVEVRMASALSHAGLTDPDLDWGGFAELEEAVRDDVHYLRGRPELGGASIEGWIYDVECRTLQRVT